MLYWIALRRCHRALSHSFFGFKALSFFSYAHEMRLKNTPIKICFVLFF